MYVYTYVYMTVVACRGQKGHQIPIHLELQAPVSCEYGCWELKSVLL